MKPVAKAGSHKITLCILLFSILAASQAMAADRTVLTEIFGRTG
jgi:hypothetical protein